MCSENQSIDLTNLTDEQKKLINFLHYNAVCSAKIEEMTLDMEGVNFYDYSTFLDETGTLNIESKYFKMWIRKRNAYCDRGRYDVMIESLIPFVSSIDEADFFPRYFFNLQRAIDEIKDFIDFRNEKITRILKEYGTGRR